RGVGCGGAGIAAERVGAGARARRVGLRQVEVEGAAAPGRAGEADLSTQQARKLPADREPQSRPAVAPARAAVLLLEGLEDDALLLGLDADAGVLDAEGDDRARPVEREMVGAPAFVDR